MKIMERSTMAVIFLIVFFSIIGVVYYFENSRVYNLNLPENEKIGRISLIQKENNKNINKDEEIKEFIDNLKGNNRTTKEESMQDYPVNVDGVIKVEFYFKEPEIASILFVYKKNNKYYIEQPYNGIYKISKDEYNSIEKYL